PSKGHLSFSSFSPDPLRSGKERVNSFCSFESVKHARPASRILESPGLAAADSCRQGSPSRKNREPEIGCCADGDSACVSVFVEGFVFWILGSCLAGRVFGFGAGARTCHSCENARVGRSRLLPSGNCTHRRPLAWNWAKRRPVSHRRSCLRRGSRPFWQRQLVRAAFDRAASHGRESPGGLAATAVSQTGGSSPPGIACGTPGKTGSSGRLGYRWRKSTCSFRSGILDRLGRARA